MANYSKTISNSIRSFGPAPSDMWGVALLNTFVWGVSKWGEGDAEIIINRDRDITVTNLLSLLESSYTTKEFYRTKTNLQPSDSETVYESLKIGPWNYIFTKPTSDAEMRNITVYTSGVAASVSYTSGVAASTVWSEA